MIHGPSMGRCHVARVSYGKAIALSRCRQPHNERRSRTLPFPHGYPKHWGTRGGIAVTAIGEPGSLHPMVERLGERRNRDRDFLSIPTTPWESLAISPDPTGLLSVLTVRRALVSSRMLILPLRKRGCGKVPPRMLPGRGLCITTGKERRGHRRRLDAGHRNVILFYKVI